MAKHIKLITGIHTYHLISPYRPKFIIPYEYQFHYDNLLKTYYTKKQLTDTLTTTRTYQFIYIPTPTNTIITIDIDQKPYIITYNIINQFHITTDLNLLFLYKKSDLLNILNTHNVELNPKLMILIDKIKF